MFAGSICVALSFPFIYHVPLTASVSVVLYYGFFIVLFQWAWAAVQVSHLAMVTELTGCKMERTLLTTIRSCFTILANMVRHTSSNHAATHGTACSPRW